VLKGKDGPPALVPMGWGFNGSCRVLPAAGNPAPMWGWAVVHTVGA